MADERREIIKKILILAIPSAIECILDTLVQYVDAAMVGHLGSMATASVSVSTNITWLINCPFYAASVGVVALTSRSWGEGNRDKIKKVASLAMWASLILGTIMLAITLSVSRSIPVWMGAEEAIHTTASRYFFIICLPMLFRAFLCILAGGIRGMGDTKTPMYITLVMNGLNIILDYLCIYAFGKEVLGAGIATAVSYTVGGLAMLVCFLRSMKISVGECLQLPEKALVNECLEISIPSAMTSICSCMGYVVFAALVSGMGTIIFAAHSLAITAEMMFYMGGHGIHAAVATLSGYSLGSKDPKLFDKIIKYSAIMMLVLMTINAVALFMLAYPVMGLFTSSPEVQRLGADMLKIVAFSEPLFGLTMVYKGAFSGLGMTKEPLYIELFGMWGVRIVFTWICVRKLGLGLEAVWYCMIADNIIKCLLLAIRFMILKAQNKLVVQ